MSEERELYEIRYLMECAVPILERIAVALEKLAPHGSEREQIALQFCLHTEQTPEEALRAADWFLAERDKQRAQQAEQRRAE
jgi:GTP cyclohydrolase III